ncbi:cornifelin homolog A-like isoform X4 [Notamacropus eugenii]|uniref:cornifelin homolog A-like isoform X4 n=1 Tax=Notamacropus eugenii TaxID=9315 RepID=UPI003B68148A
MIPYPESGPSETQTRGVAPHHQFSQRPRRRIPYPSCHLLKPSSETPPLQRTKSKGPLVTSNVFYRALSPKLQAINDWNRALFDFSYTNLCVNGALLPCLLACFVANTQGECCCLPYLPGALVAMRTSLRATQGIQGSIAEDWLVMCCCPICGLCQMAHQQDNSTT